MSFRINKGVFQFKDTVSDTFINKFKIDDRGDMVEVDEEGNKVTAYMRLGDKAHDADLLDGIDSGAFLRSNADDNVTGHTEWQDNYQVRLGSGADLRIWHDGNNHVFRSYHHGANYYFQLEDNEGTNRNAIQLVGNTSRSYVILYEDGNERLRTTSDGVQIGKLSVGATTGTWVTSNQMSDSIGWNGNHGVYIGSDTTGSSSYVYGDGTFYKNGTNYTLIHSGTIGSQSVDNADKLDGSHRHEVGNRDYTRTTFYVDGDENTYYPVLITPRGGYAFNRWSISRRYNWTAPWDPIGTGNHKGGLTFDFYWAGDTAWGGNDKSIRIHQFSEQYTTMVGGISLARTGGMIVWLRGGHAYYELQVDTAQATVDVKYEPWTDGSGVTYEPTEDVDQHRNSIWNNYPVRNGDDLYINNRAVATEQWTDDTFLRTTEKAADSNLLDGIDSSSFLRSDANDTFTGTLTSTKNGTAIVMDGGASAEGLRVKADSTTTYPVFLRSIAASNGETSPWIYKENNSAWGIWHNNPLNSFDFTRSSNNLGIENNVGGQTNSVMIRLNNTDGSGIFKGNVTASSFIGNATTATTASNLGSYYTADTWFRATSDNNTVKFYGNSRMMVFRTDGEGGDTGHTGYAFKWTYGGDGTGNTLMLLDNNGNVWTKSYGWLHSRFETAGAAGTVETTLNARIEEEILPAIDGKLGATAKAADSDLLDGLDSSAFLRSNASDDMYGTLTIHSGGTNTYARIRGYGNDNHFIVIRGSVTTGQSTLTITGAHRTTFVEHADDSNEGWYFVSKASGNYTEKARIDGLGNIYSSNIITNQANIQSITSDGTIANDKGSYLHLGGWAVGRTHASAVLVNTAYRADYAESLFDMNISRFTNNSGYITQGSVDALAEELRPQIEEAQSTADGKLGATAKAADSNLLDGIDSGSFLRSDANDTFTGTITMGKQHALVANNYGRGVYGVYSSTRYQHVWSMGTAYNLADNGTGTGNLYGISWTHSNVGGESISGLGHQMLIMSNGDTRSAIGDGIWTKYNIYASGGNSTQWNTAYGWGNHAGLYDSAGSAAGVDARINEEVLPQVTTNATNIERNATELASKLGTTGKAADADKLDGYDWMQSGKAVRGSEVYADGWLRNYNSNKGLYNHATGQHWYSDDDDYWNIAGGSAANGIRFRDEHAGTIRGYVYANNSNQIGFLDAGGSWAIKHTNDSRTEFYDADERVFSIGQGGHGSNYGTVCTHGGGRGGYEGYSINERFVWMSADNNLCGMYNDMDNEWMTIWRRNGSTELMHNGSKKLETTSGGVTVTGTVSATAFSGNGSGLTNLTIPDQRVPVTINGEENTKLASINMNLDRGLVEFTMDNGQTFTAQMGR